MSLLGFERLIGRTLPPPRRSGARDVAQVAAHARRLLHPDLRFASPASLTPRGGHGQPPSSPAPGASGAHGGRAYPHLMAAIELKGVVKRFGDDHRGGRAGPRGAAGHLPRPARAQRRRQVDDDAAAHRAGDRRRGRAARARATSCRARPRRRAPRWASCRSSTTSTSTSPSRTTSPCSRASTASRDVRAAVERGLDAGAPAGAPPRRGRQALGRDAPPAAAGARARARPAPDAARRADRRARPADPHRAVVADRRAALAGHDDPDVDALHRGGRAARRRGGRDGARQDHRPRPARRPDRRARGPRDRRGLRAAGAARRGARRRPRRRACACARPGPRSRSSAPSARRTAPCRRTRSAAPPPWRTCSCCSPGRRPNEAARAGGDHRRDEPRGGELPHVLEGDDVLERARADHLPARVRASASARRSSTGWTGSSTSSSSAPGWSPRR